MAKTANELAEFIEQQLIDIAETAEDHYALEALEKLNALRRERAAGEKTQGTIQSVRGSLDSCYCSRYANAGYVTQ